MAKIRRVMIGECRPMLDAWLKPSTIRVEIAESEWAAHRVVTYLAANNAPRLSAKQISSRHLASKIALSSATQALSRAIGEHMKETLDLPGKPTDAQGKPIHAGNRILVTKPGQPNQWIATADWCKLTRSEKQEWDIVESKRSVVTEPHQLPEVKVISSI